jgi:sulfate transport system substrate-binding protein
MSTEPTGFGGFMKARTLAIAALVAAALALAVAGCGGASDSSTAAGASGAAGAAKGELSLVAYSTPQVVYDQIIPGFQRTEAGQGIGFRESFGASGDQSRAVAAGQPADVVAFSLAPDMDKLAQAGIVARDWASTPTKGMVSDSVVVFVVRRGNPKHIRTWADLLRPGVRVLTPNPFSSGGAKWNLMAAYGAASGAGRNRQAGLAYVRDLITNHVVVQDKSGRESLQNFISGNGDVALSYENEAITAQRKGADVDYVVPRQTLEIENPIAVTTRSAHPAAARAFVRYALSPPGQEAFAAWGYRPVDRSVLAAHAARFPTPPGLFTIADLGGWPKVDDVYFDVDHGLFAQIEQDAGVSTAR